MVTLITNRTQNHVDRLKKLLAKGWENLSNSEKTEYRGIAAYGAYNYTDLNRVESAVAELAGMLGLSLTTKTNWTVADIPTKGEMERYLSNVITVYNACPNPIDQHPPLPTSMTKLSYVWANNIEETLQIVYDTLGVTSELGVAVLGRMVLGE